jgi:hypothetical protein
MSRRTEDHFPEQTRILGRYTNQHAEDERKLAKILLETGEPAPITTTTQATLPGDKRRLRGIPVVGGVSGTSPGTDPYFETERRMMPWNPQ